MRRDTCLHGTEPSWNTWELIGLLNGGCKPYLHKVNFVILRYIFLNNYKFYSPEIWHTVFISFFIYWLFLACKTFLNSSLDGDVRPASRPGRFTPRETAPGTHCVGGWMGPRAGLGVMEKRKFACLCRESNPDSSVYQAPVAQSLYRLSYPGSSLPIFYVKLK
jgi:hypothetical protein